MNDMPCHKSTREKINNIIYKYLQRTKSDNLLSNLRLKIKIYGKL